MASSYIVRHSSLPSIHAEHEGLTKLMRINRYRRYLSNIDEVDVLVVRVSASGCVGYSRPCHDCLLRMINCPFNINAIYYTDADGTIVSEKFYAMYDSPLTKFTNGRRKRDNKTF